MIIDMLLVLDNCEHLLDACAALAHTLLRACPHASLLATSREPLAVLGEVTWQVPSLSLPDPVSFPAPEQALAYGAIRLFVERARLVRPSFALTDGNSAAVARLCRHLDGIPLAIELAAAWVRALSVEQIDLRLADRFRLLTGGSRAALRRHQTLRAAIDWSYDLLPARERALFHRLSVFAGSWTLEAAEAVCADGETENREIAPADVLDLLAHLVDKSLAVAEDQAGAGRYRLLETIRQYADEKLDGSGEKEPVRSRHRDWYVALAERAWSALYGPNESVWLDRLAIDHDNLRAALEWCERGPHGVEAALRLAGMLTFSWATRGYLTEGQTQLANVLSMEGAPSFPAAWARAMWGAALLSYYRGNLDAARSLGAQALGIRRSLGDQAGVIQSLKDLGLTVYEQRDYPAARALLEEAAALSRQTGDEPNTATSLDRLAAIAHATGDLPSAQALCAESSAIRQRLGYDWGRAWSFFNLGCVAFDRGDHAAARRLLRESLALSRADSNQDRMIRLLDVFAALDVAQGQPARAVRLAGAAAALHEAGGLRTVRIERERSARALGIACQALGEDTFAAAWAEGRTLSLEQASAVALHAEPGS